MGALRRTPCRGPQVVASGRNRGGDPTIGRTVAGGERGGHARTVRDAPVLAHLALTLDARDRHPRPTIPRSCAPTIKRGVEYLAARRGESMKRVLITGMSGTGKSAVIRELAARGYEARDLDTSEWSQWIDIDPSDSLTPARGKDWVWQEDRVRALLLRPRSMPLFVSGCAENMGRLLHLMDEIVLLSAPVLTVMERLAARPGGYGSSEDDRRKVRELISTIEPRLRQLASHEIDTRGSTATTVDAVLRAVL
jgi:shikimate kinase